MRHRILKTTDKGFTIVEIMVVVAIVVVLAVIAIPNLLRARVNAHDAAAQTALKSIATALETYASAHSVYPSETTSLIGVVPPYLGVDYFTGIHSGYTFNSTFTPNTYTATATPISPQMGTTTYTITTGGILTPIN